MKFSTLLLSFLVCNYAQSQLSVPNGSFTLSAGNVLSLQGLSLTPATPLSLSGLNVQHSNTPVFIGGTVNSITQVITFSTPVQLTGVVQLDYTDGDLNGNPEAALVLDYQSAGVWRSSSASVVNTTDNNVTETVTSKTFDGVTASAYVVPLPVSLLSLNASLQANQSVLVKWQTADEANNSHFTIERSIDGATYTAIGNVPATSLNGRGNYTFTDPQPVVGLNYYRLLQHDVNGSFKILGVRVIKMATPSLLATISSNPVSGNGFFLDLRKPAAQPLTYTITNSLGQLTQTGRITTQKQWIATSSLARGSYILQLSDGQAIRFQQQ